MVSESNNIPGTPRHVSHLADKDQVGRAVPSAPDL